MKKVFFTFILLQLCLMQITFSQDQKKSVITVDVEHPGATIQPTMWGIFFEDINMAADGGIYAEMIKNRSFEFANPRTGWKVKARTGDSSAFMILNRYQQSPSNPRFARIKVFDDRDSCYLFNYGFRGMGIKKDNLYRFSMLASSPEGIAMKFSVELIDSKGNVIGDTLCIIEGKAWKKYTAVINANATDSHGGLRILFLSPGMVDIDMISLFPADTWKGREGGLRSDLVQLLSDLKPGFLRFPGGCIVEGRELATRYQWKETIGDVADRHLIINRWNTEFRHRPTPDYYQSFGLGFFEYFQLAEDIGAEPVPILNCGMACQFNTAEVVPVNEIDPYIRDVLDLIEFANGSADSEWGRKRVAMGHPQPFDLKIVGIGNEQWGPQYFERLGLFEKAVHARYPDIQLVLAAGPSAEGGLFDFAWSELNKMKPQIVDEHYYKEPAWFLNNTTRYDSYDRNGHKIFAGEYAAQSDFTTSPHNRNNWQCALSEAAYMTGLERNADVVYMSSYAPLFAHVDGWQWTPDLIWFDNLRSYGTPNYYVQKLFSTNRGTKVLKMLSDEKPLTGQRGIYGSAVLDENAGEIILKIVNASSEPINQELKITTGRKVSGVANLSQLQADLQAVNTLDVLNVRPVESQIKLKGKKIDCTFPAYSVNVIKIKQL